MDAPTFENCRTMETVFWMHVTFRDIAFAFIMFQQDAWLTCALLLHTCMLQIGRNLVRRVVNSVHVTMTEELGHDPGDQPVAHIRTHARPKLSSERRTSAAMPKHGIIV